MANMGDSGHSAQMQSQLCTFKKTNILLKSTVDCPNHHKMTHHVLMHNINRAGGRGRGRGWVVVKLIAGKILHEDPKNWKMGT